MATPGCIRGRDKPIGGIVDSETFIQSWLSNELEHHGVKGMRWGHRKAPVRSSRQTSSSTNKSSNRSSKKTPSKKSKIKSMSDSEIQSRIKRLEMEKRLSTLSNEDRHPGTNFVKNALKDSGKQVLTTVGKNAMLGGLRYATDKSFTGKDFAKSLAGGSSKKKGADK